jgi:hypothetical protein
VRGDLDFARNKKNYLARSTLEKTVQYIEKSRQSLSGLKILSFPLTEYFYERILD